MMHSPHSGYRKAKDCPYIEEPKMKGKQKGAALDLGAALALAAFCGLTLTQVLGRGPGTGAP